MFAHVAFPSLPLNGTFQNFVKKYLFCKYLVSKLTGKFKMSYTMVFNAVINFGFTPIWKS